MKTKEEIKKWLLENCVDNFGNLYLRGLDFSDFEGTVDISCMKVKKSLYQSNQEVGWSLCQNCQEVGKDLDQSFQKVGEDLYQHRQTVRGNFYSHKLEEGEMWGVDEDCGVSVKRVKKLKPITRKELKEMGYELVE